MQQKSYKTHTEWHEFFGFHKPTLNFFDNTVEEVWIDSGKEKIHLDVYNTDPKNPVVIYCHGLSSCGRIMGNMTRVLYQKGYNVICPDLTGFGLSSGKSGGGTLTEFIQNLLDTISYAQKRFKGPRFLAGISMGGGLSYYTACESPAINAVAPLCLMDFSAAETLAISQRAKLVKLLWPLLQLGKSIAPNVYLPLNYFLDPTRLSSSPDVIKVFINNPLALKRYTVKFAHSLLTTKPKVAFENFNKIPILVLHAANDQLIPESLTKSNYDKIPGKKAYYKIENCDHIPLHPQTIRNYMDQLDQWFRKNG